MNKNEVLEMINSDIYLLERATNTLYHNKVYAISNCSRVDKFIKTKRGAEGYIKKNSSFSYYDDYTQDMVTPHVSDTTIEILASELKDIKTDKKLWHDYLRNNLSTVFMYHMGQNIVCTAKNAEVTEELLKYIEETIKEIEETHSMSLIEEYLENENIVDVEEVEQDQNTSVETPETTATEQQPQNTVETVLDHVSIKSDINTKTKEDIFVAKLNNRTNYETFKAFETEVKSIDGYYSRFKKGFIFKEDPTEKLLTIDVNILTNNSEVSYNSEPTTIETNYPEIDINDIETYTVSAELSKRENNNSMFRSKDTDHTKELQKTLQSANNDVIELCNMEGCISYIEYKAKSYLQSFKKKYAEAYISVLTHRANNPGWHITGRSGLNIRRYNKKQDQLTNKMKYECQLIDDFNEKIQQYKNKIQREQQQKFKTELENNLNSIGQIPQFKRVKIKYNGDATAYNNIFNLDTASYVAEGTAHQLEGYSIIKNWGCFRVYNKDGQEVWSTKTNETLETAKKYVLYLLSQDQQEQIQKAI